MLYLTIFSVTWPSLLVAVTLKRCSPTTDVSMAVPEATVPAQPSLPGFSPGPGGKYDLGRGPDDGVAVVQVP